LEAAVGFVGDGAFDEVGGEDWVEIIGVEGEWVADLIGAGDFYQRSQESGEQEFDEGL